MVDKARKFVPGYKPGPWASGFNADSHLMALAAKHLKMANIPVGDDVSAHFPWLRYVHERSLGAGEQIVVKRQQWDDTFTNQTPRPILINEVRLYLGNQYVREEPPRVGGGIVHGHPVGAPPTVSLLQKALWVKMSIPDRKDILQKWMPYPMINTVGDFNMTTEVDRFAFPLPAPYFLNRSHPFLIDIAKNEALATPLREGTDTAFFLTLHGWGERDGEPIDLIKRVPTFRGADVDPTQYLTLAFDEDRDMPMRDAWITHIGIGAGSTTNATLKATSAWLLQNAQIRPHAPEGPNWHSGEFFPVAMLAEQISAVEATSDEATYYLSGARHIPAVPYILFPGESFKVELWNRTDIWKQIQAPPGAEAVDLNVDVALIGLQEKL